MNIVNTCAHHVLFSRYTKLRPPSYVFVCEPAFPVFASGFVEQNLRFTTSSLPTADYETLSDGIIFSPSGVPSTSSFHWSLFPS